MQIKKNQVVSIHYKLNENDHEGELIEETYSGEPLTFIYGIGMMLPAFEEHLENKSANDKFVFTLTPEDAYGAYEDDAVIAIPISNFADESGNVDREGLVPGSPINMHDDQGRSFMGTIQEVNDETIVVDFNHPLAGRSLHFHGDILEVRDATPSELEHGHVHHHGHDHH